MNWKLFWDCFYLCRTELAIFLFFKRSQKYCSKSWNITHQAAEFLFGVIFCNYESYKHCINITIPLREIDCLTFQASNHSLPCHKYLHVTGAFLCLHHSLWVFSEIVWSAPMLSFQWTDHKRPNPAVSWVTEKTTADRRPRRHSVMWDKAWL